MAELSSEEMAEWENALAAEPRSALREAEVTRGLATADERHAVYAARVGMSVAEWRTWVQESGEAQVALGHAREAERAAKALVTPPDDPTHGETKAAWVTECEALDVARQRVADLLEKSARGATGARENSSFLPIPL